MTSTSSILAGERRWASARRGGMTVLGKVAAPKPLNLPSQRLENHGLDPNVEIVPKGTLSWGGRSTSAASNPWGSLTLSPNADSSPGSSHLSARPSSGGSGTRPSTAGSDKLHEPAANVWGNSRPSSASGALTSSQTSSTSLRPCSAETRPGSSQLSRFAEPSSETSGAWGATRTTEKLGVVSSKSDEFSLSSGDFPTLSSGKENSGKNIESQGYGSRPSSSSGIVGSAKVMSSTSQDDVKSRASDSWGRDDQAHIRDGVHSGADKRQGDPQQYLNANVPTQHFDAWRGPPINASPGVWYTGPPAGPPYGAPVAPGGFPMEPFPYYRPQIPPPALANSQPVPPSGPGLRGHHPKNRDLFRPQIPDAFIRPNMPMRPGFYPGRVPYEGFYGPPMGYCNSNKRDIPFMGMPSGPHVYNGVPAPNGPDHVINHARAGGCGSMGKERASEQPESVHVDGDRAPYKVLLKQHNDWDGNVEEDNWEQSLPADVSSLEKNNQPRTTLRKFEWGADDERNNETPLTKTTAGEKSSGQTFDNRGGCTLESVPVESPGRMFNSKGVDNSWAARSEMESAAFDEAPQALTSNSRDSTLIQKIEGLNAKARASDGQHDIVSTTSREEQKKRFHAHNVKAISPAIEDGNATGSSGPTSGVSAGDSIVPPPAASEMPVSRKAYHGGQGRGDLRGKGRHLSHDADGWRKRSPASEASGAVVASSELSSNYHSRDGHASVEVLVKSHIVFQGKDETESSMPMLDTSDSEAQRAKMRELAKQRAIQLQKEEEERTREQKAKALVKLEELNWRTQVGVGLGHKVEEISPSSAMKPDEQELPTLAEPVVDATNYEAPNSTLVSNRISVAQISETIAPDVGESNSLSGDTYLDKPKNAEQEHLPHGQSRRLKQNVCEGDTADCKAAPHNNDVSAPRQKRMGYRQKQNASLDKIPIECQIHSTETAKIHTDASCHTVSAEVAARRVGSNCESSLPSDSSTTADSSSHQRKRNNRSGKNKYNMEEASLIGALPLTETKGSHPAKPLTECAKSADTKLELDGGSIQLVADSKHTIQPSEQASFFPSEEALGRVNNQWKSQHSRRMPRNAQANRLADKGFGNDAVIWAPVRSHNKVEAGDEGSQKTVPGVVAPAGKSDNLLQINMKSKRVEMERYVPKPVAKEMAEQGSSQQPVASSYNQTSPDEAVGNADSGLQQSESSRPAGSATRSVGSRIELKNMDGKQNKQPKSHEPWRRRGLAESSHIQGLPQASSSSHPSKVVEKSLEQDKSMKPNVVIPQTQPKCSDKGNTSDGWNMPETYNAAEPVIPPAVKDRGLTGKGKKHPFKGQRNKDSNSDHDLKNASTGKIERSHIQSAPVEISQTDRIASKENRGPVEQASHWQPKSQSDSGNNRWGRNFNGGQTCSSETSRGIQKDSLQDRVDFQSQPDEDSSETVTHPHQGPSVSESKHLAEKTSSRHPDGRRERKAAPSRGHPYSPNQVPLYADEPSHAGSADARNEPHFSGFCKNGSQNSRSGLGHDSKIDGSSAGKDNRQQNTPANRERHRHNSHYEFQPVGPHNSSKFNNLEGSTDGLQNTGSRYREKGQGHSRRGGGNSHGQQSGSARVDAGRG